MQYNASGLLRPIKRSKMLSKLKKETFYVAFLQETHFTEGDTKLGKMGFKHLFSSSYMSGEGWLY